MKQILLILSIAISISILLPVISAETHFYAGDRQLAQKIGDDLEYTYSDRLGTPLTSKHLPFGQNIQGNERFTFTGKEEDNSGLNYHGARYYDSNLGKWTSIDPIEKSYPYQYSHNNPLTFVDPDGRETEIALSFQWKTRLIANHNTVLRDFVVTMNYDVLDENGDIVGSTHLHTFSQEGMRPQNPEHGDSYDDIIQFAVPEGQEDEYGSFPFSIRFQDTYTLTDEEEQMFEDAVSAGHTVVSNIVKGYTYEWDSPITDEDIAHLLELFGELPFELIEENSDGTWRTLVDLRLPHRDPDNPDQWYEGIGYAIRTYPVEFLPLLNTPPQPIVQTEITPD